MLRKAISLLLTLMLLLSVTAYAEDTAEATDDLMTPYGRYSETVTFTSGRVVAPKLPADQTYEDNVMMRYIEKVLNVKVQNEWWWTPTATTRRLPCCSPAAIFRT